MMQAAPFMFGSLALAACAAAPAKAPEVPGYAATHEGVALVVTRSAQPFGYADGAEARRAADRFCGGRVNSSPEDNYRADPVTGGAWIYPRGCA